MFLHGDDIRAVALRRGCFRFATPCGCNARKLSAQTARVPLLSCGETACKALQRSEHERFRADHIKPALAVCLSCTMQINGGCDMETAARERWYVQSPLFGNKEGPRRQSEG